MLRVSVVEDVVVVTAGTHPAGSTEPSGASNATCVRPRLSVIVMMFSVVA